MSAEEMIAKVLSSQQPFSRKAPLRVELSEDDIGEAVEIAELMVMPGWAKLQKHVEVLREKIIEHGKDSSGTKSGAEISPYIWSFLKGFDIASTVAKAIVDRADEYNRSRQGDQHDGNEQP